VSERDRYARSFGSVADLYEASRPLFAEAAVDWVASKLPLHDVLDLAAGTGKLTRQLLARGAHVVAVEPDPDMRATFARALPEVTMLDGRAEAIPLADGAVDVVTVGQAFHWFEPETALAEMRRVSRPGGGYALLWNIWSEDDPVLSQVRQLFAGSRVPVSPWRDGLGEFERQRFGEHNCMTVEQIEGWAASTSAFVRAPREEQEAMRARLREIVGGPVADVLIETDVLVADRV
jgi:ubiquinone/menaquinone biosynthesis C-methylase UbiE